MLTKSSTMECTTGEYFTEFYMRRTVRIAIFCFLILFIITNVLCASVPLSNYLTANKTSEINETNTGFSTNGDMIFASRGQFLKGQQPVCKDEMFLVVIVCSAAENYHQREAIRQTWGSQHYQTNHQVFFLLGVREDRRGGAIKENTKYKDIIQGNFLDSYRNLTLKSIVMLEWINRFCNTSAYYLKTDDDMFINVQKLLTDLKNTIHNNFIMGDIIAGAYPMQDRKSKWYTPQNSYAGSTYPKYVSGSAYVISGDAVGPLYISTLKTPMFWIEDIYITGLCAMKANVQIIYNSRFSYKKRPLDPCILRSLITAHRINPEKLRFIWKLFHDPFLNC